MGKLLFSPEGRIGPTEFRKGAVILLAANFFLWLSWHVNFGVGMLVGVLSLTFIYCWACLFSKRFHDAGKSGGFFALVFLAFVVLSYIISSIFLAGLSPDIVPMVAEVQEKLDPSNPDIEYMMEAYTKIFKTFAIPYAVGYLLAGAGIAFLTNKFLKSDPEDNQYGAGQNDTFG